MNRDALTVIRADCGPRVGNGHVMRTLALAQAWKDDGGDVAYFQATTTPGIERRLQAERVGVVYQAVEPGSDADAESLVHVAVARTASWIVLDGYHFSDRYQHIVKRAGLRLLLLDDVGSSGHFYADIVLNQDLNAAESLYRNREPHAKLLLGTKYVLLRREFRHCPRQPRDFGDRPKTLLVTMGGSDPDNVTRNVIEAVTESARADLIALVVIGPSNPHGPSLEAAAKDCPRIHLLRSPTNLPELMAQCDVAITAGGSTIWELAYFAVPTIVLVIAENQRPCAEQLQAREACLVLDEAENNRPQVLAGSVDRFLGDSQWRAACSSRLSAMVDGRGAMRVCEAMKAVT